MNQLGADSQEQILRARRRFTIAIVSAGATLAMLFTLVTFFNFQQMEHEDLIRSSEVQRLQELLTFQNEQSVEITSNVARLKAALEVMKVNLDQPENDPLRSILEKIEKTGKSLGAKASSFRTGELDGSGYLNFFSFVANAYAQPTSADSSYGAFNQGTIRGIVIVIVFFALLFAFIASILIIAMSKNEKSVAFAMDTVKTLIGFCVGVGSTFLGISH